MSGPYEQPARPTGGPQEQARPEAPPPGWQQGQAPPQGQRGQAPQRGREEQYREGQYREGREGQYREGEYQQGQYVPRPATGYDDTGQAYEKEPARRGGAHWTPFAAVILMVSGLWSFLEGMAAILSGHFFTTLPAYEFATSIRTWGWLHFALGIAVFVAGVCLLTDMLWARMFGVVMAVFSLLGNFMFLPYAPVWSVVVIALDVFVIWALMSPRRGEAEMMEGRSRHTGEARRREHVA